MAQQTKLPANELLIGDVKIFEANGTITTGVSLADDAVTTAKILNANVTTAKIATGNITNTLLATDVKVGSLAALTTTEKGTAVGAISEVDANADTAGTNASTALTRIGTLASLTTTEKTTLVGAINEIDAGNAAQVTLTGTQTLTNKTLTSPLISDGDAGLTITSADQTSGSATATVPNIGDAADTFCMVDTSQTLTNKTLTSPTLTTPIIVTTGAIDDAGGDPYLTFVEAATPLNSIQITQGNTTVKPIIAAIGETNIGLQLMGKGTGKVTIVDAATPTKALNFELVGATAATTTTITASQTGNVTVTLPDATDTLVGKATSDVLTNKTLTSAVLTTPQINDTSADHQYVFAVSELTGDRTVTLPLLTAPDEFVFKDFIQTFTNKTLTTPVIASLYQDAGKTLTVTMPAATDTLVGKATTDTLTNKTLTSPIMTTMKINDGDQYLTITSANQTDSGATATIPNIVDSADTFVMADMVQTITNKTVGIPDDSLLTLGTTTATATTKITMEFDETTTGIGQLIIGTADNPQVLNASPGATVKAESIALVHSAGAGTCDDLIASYKRIAVTGAGDSGLTIIGDAPRTYVGVTGGANNSVASAAYASQPWAKHEGTGAITAMSALSALVDVNADNFTATTVNAGHFHIEGAATVTAQFDGVMIEAYNDVTCMDSLLALVVDSGGVADAAIRLSGATANDFLKFGATGHCGCTTSDPTVGPANTWIKCHVGSTIFWLVGYADS